MCPAFCVPSLVAEAEATSSRVCYMTLVKS